MGGLLFCSSNKEWKWGFTHPITCIDDSMKPISLKNMYELDNTKICHNTYQQFKPLMINKLSVVWSPFWTQEVVFFALDKTNFHFLLSKDHNSCRRVSFRTSYCSWLPTNQYLNTKICRCSILYVWSRWLYWLSTSSKWWNSKGKDSVTPESTDNEF